MPAKSTIIACPNCGKKNRVRPSPSGVPRCSVCRTLLPWIVDAAPDSFDEEIKASVPVVVDFWAPWCGPVAWSRRWSSTPGPSTPAS